MHNPGVCKDFWDRTQKTHIIKFENLMNWTSSKLKTSAWKETFKKIKNQITDWEKIIHSTFI